MVNKVRNWTMSEIKTDNKNDNKRDNKAESKAENKKLEKITAVKGMNDILPADAPLWELFENTVHSVALRPAISLKVARLISEVPATKVAISTLRKAFRNCAAPMVSEIIKTSLAPAACNCAAPLSTLAAVPDSAAVPARLMPRWRIASCTSW